MIKSDNKDQYYAQTHEVENVPSAFDYNLFTSDTALVEVCNSFASNAVCDELVSFGAYCGSERAITLGFQANEFKPTLKTHDRFGRRVDEVSYHPAYHELMAASMGAGIHSSHWASSDAGRHVIRSIKSYLITQTEAGHGCPITMTSAAIPTLRKEPSLFAEWAPKILNNAYQPDNIPYTQKSSVTIGMAMTEKQGGSDVRRNTTQAHPISQPGRSQAYELVGHKYFVSAPMSDAFLMLAQTKGGLSCFLVPRWRPDGTKNPIQIQQLKNKMGNVSNASSETELRGALGWLVGEEGRGVATIIEMVSMTRFDCMIGSSAGMRQAVAQSIHHCTNRAAFGAPLVQQPLMKNVLADLALESEAALVLTMRMAKAIEDSEHDPQARMLMRIGTAVGKYWVCKRTPNHAYEAMECIGGMGVMEDTPMPRLFRESPVNAIWEGSGNVQCLDLLRALERTPDTIDALFHELEPVRGQHSLLDDQLDKVKRHLLDKSDMQYRARQVIADIALALQASTLWQFGDSKIAEAFCEARLGEQASPWLYGGLPTNIDVDYVIQRASPKR